MQSLLILMGIIIVNRAQFFETFLSFWKQHILNALTVLCSLFSTTMEMQSDRHPSQKFLELI